MSDDIPDVQEDTATEEAMSAIAYYHFICTMADEGEVDEDTLERYVTTLWEKQRQECPALFDNTMVRVIHKESYQLGKQMHKALENGGEVTFISIGKTQHGNEPTDPRIGGTPSPGGMFGFGAPDR